MCGSRGLNSTARSVCAIASSVRPYQISVKLSAK
jgi:hypothetical protein